MDYPKIHVALKSQAKPIKKDKEGAWVKIEPFLPATTKWNMYNVPGEKNARLGNPYESKEDYPMAKNKCRKDEDGTTFLSFGPKSNLFHRKSHNWAKKYASQSNSPWPL